MAGLTWAASGSRGTQSLRNGISMKTMDGDSGFLHPSIAEPGLSIASRIPESCVEVCTYSVYVSKWVCDEVYIPLMRR